MSDLDYGHKNLAQLAKEAIEVQNASNLSGVVHGFSRAIGRLRQILEQDLGSEFSTRKLNEHPICIVWSATIANLTKSDHFLTYVEAVDDCNKIISEWDKG